MKSDLTSLEHLRQTAVEARGMIADVSIFLPVRREAVLTAAGWNGTAAPFTQTVSVEGVRADEAGQMVQIAPGSAARQAWEAAGIRCTGQGNGTLGFTAKAKPSANINIYVILQEVLG